MNVNFKVAGVKEVTDFIKSVPVGVKAAAMRAISEYIVGDTQHGLKHDVAYKYIPRENIPVTMTVAYGPHKGKSVKGYYSTKQYYYVILGNVKSGRKQTLTNYSQSWRWEQKGSQWDRTKITGTAPFSGFPSTHNKLAGWRHWSEVVQSNLKGAIRSGQAAVNEWIKSRKR